MTPLPLPSPYLLYAEDDPDDQEALRETIASVAPEVSVITCNQGLELMQYLEKLEVGQALPCCIILDLNMPLWDGLKTLEAIKKHADFMHLPVVLFTTSASSREAVRAKALGAEAFITKPVRQQEFQEVSARFSIFCDYPVTVRYASRL